MTGSKLRYLDRITNQNYSIRYFLNYKNIFNFNTKITKNKFFMYDYKFNKNNHLENYLTFLQLKKSKQLIKNF